MLKNRVWVITFTQLLCRIESPNAPTITDILAKPWLPFTPALWLMIICFVVFVSASVTLITDNANEGDFGNSRVAARWMKAAWMNAMGFVSRSIKNNPKSTPARVAAFGYGFFLLVTLQSYTAALASILVARTARFSVNSFKDVLDSNKRVCVLQAISEQMKALHARGNYVLTPDWPETFRDLNLNKCDAALVSCVPRLFVRPAGLFR